MVRGPQVVREFCPCVPSKKTEEKIIYFLVKAYPNSNTLELLKNENEFSSINLIT
jgi:hypothetical protein